MVSSERSHVAQQTLQVVCKHRFVLHSHSQVANNLAQLNSLSYHNEFASNQKGVAYARWPPTHSMPTLSSRISTEWRQGRPLRMTCNIHLLATLCRRRCARQSYILHLCRRRWRRSTPLSCGLCRRSYRSVKTRPARGSDLYR